MHNEVSLVATPDRRKCRDAFKMMAVSLTAAKSTASTHSLGQAEISLHSPFEPEYLFDLSLQHNSKAKRALFEQRVKNKRWLQTYPKLRDNG